MKEGYKGYSPLSEIAKELNVNNEKLYYHFQTHKEDTEEYLRVESVIKGDKKISKYYVRNDFVPKYQKSINKEITETSIRKYEMLYYAYVEREEEKIAKEGKSIATNKELWADMQIVDSYLSKKCLKRVAKEKDKSPNSNDRKSIGDVVYRHIFTKKYYFDICLSTIEEELKNES